MSENSNQQPLFKSVSSKRKKRSEKTLYSTGFSERMKQV